MHYIHIPTTSLIALVAFTFAHDADSPMASSMHTDSMMETNSPMEAPSAMDTSTFDPLIQFSADIITTFSEVTASSPMTTPNPKFQTMSTASSHPPSTYTPGPLRAWTLGASNSFVTNTSIELYNTANCTGKPFRYEKMLAYGALHPVFDTGTGAIKSYKLSTTLKGDEQLDWFGTADEKGKVKVDANDYVECAEQWETGSPDGEGKGLKGGVCVGLKTDAEVWVSFMRTLWSGGGADGEKAMGKKIMP